MFASNEGYGLLGQDMHSNGKSRRWWATIGTMVVIGSALVALSSHGRSWSYTRDASLTAGFDAATGLTSTFFREIDESPAADWKKIEIQKMATIKSVSTNDDLSLAADVIIEPSTSETGWYYCLSWQLSQSDLVKNGTLWSAWKPIASTTTKSTLFRFRPYHTYTVKLWTSHSEDEEPTHVDTATYHSGSSGVWLYDEGPLGHVHGSPTWDLVLTDHAVGKHKDSGFNDVNSSGPIAIDPEGFVVWMYNAPAHGLTGIAQVNTQMVSSNDILLLDSSTKTLFELKADGSQVSNHTISCESASIDGFRSINHEIREDAHNPKRILTLVQKIVRETDMTFPQLTDGIAEWQPDESGKKVFSVKYWLDDYFDVKTARSSYSNKFLSETCGHGNDTYTVQDWTHANSIDATEDVYIVSVRSLSAVVAFAKEGHGHGVLWTLTSDTELSSNFTFIPESARFYNQHDVTVIGHSGDKMTIAMMDNGDERPHCHATVPDGNCWSRGVEYELDFKKWTCTLIWEFRPGTGWHGDEYLFSKAKGSVAKISEYNRLVAFDAIIWPNETTKQKDDNSSMVVYEIDKIYKNKPEVKSYMTIPSDMAWTTYPYRAVPITQIAGETLHTQNLTLC